MAPPPPASLPLQQRLLHLVQTLQFAWFVGHLTLLFCTFRYGLSYFTFHPSTRTARFSYRTAFVAAAVTYGIVVFKAYRARSRSGKVQQTGLLALAGDENVQYLAMALVWLFFQQVPLALLPFTIYSVFHVATYTRTNLIPTFQPPKPSSTGASPGGRPAKSTSPLAEQIGNFVKKNYDTSMTLVASLELSLWFRVLFSAILFTKGSWMLLALYTIFVRARYSQCSFVQNAVSQGSARIDALVSAQGTPPAVRQIWDTIKQLARQGTEATDIGKYLQPHEAGGKKAQ